MQLARANIATRAAGAAPFRRVVGVSALARPASLLQIGSGASRVVARATDSGSASDAAAAALDKAAAAATEAASKAKDTASAAASKLKDKLNQATLDVDIKQLLQYNFLAQLVLTAVSWAVVFFTSHINMAKITSPPTLKGSRNP
ncbi:hypothetical protein Rsub_11375 [Raphidocelis subcapitata]|uniref:Uncharacterized protein n=1 Tax=Raphidocelis subcapitata TaxID=307507 RepID=A0A2V0PL86_9CHLO|nr:hypothetical protein Rsub_11375 [Raphidocelis subcapitata]|eukprot:GBF98793.1 hypothetical protein Rsub_11375 [Raphidocelis subcapitata]